MKKILLVGILIIGIVSLVLMGSSNKPNTLSTWGVFHSGTDSEKIELKQGDEVFFTYKANILMGDLTMTLIDPDGEVVLEMEPLADGKANYKADAEGVFKVIIKKSGVFARYSINWEIS